MKVELTQKELRKLIGLLYSSYVKDEEFLQELKDTNSNIYDAEALKKDIVFKKELYNKLGSYIEL